MRASTWCLAHRGVRAAYLRWQRATRVTSVRACVRPKGSAHRNRAKYPAERCYGSAAKYTAYQEKDQS